MGFKELLTGKGKDYERQTKSGESEYYKARGEREYEKARLKMADYKSIAKEKKRQHKIKYAKQYQSAQKFRKLESKIKSFSSEGSRSREKKARSTIKLYETFAPLSPGIRRGPASESSSGYNKPGRPRGVYKNYIPGVGPVHIYEYRKWLRHQKAVRQMGAQTPQQYQQAQEQPRYQQAQSRYSQPIRSDNILHAPNFMKGELRNIGQNSGTPQVDNSNIPNSNRQGDQYVDVDPMSGKPILQRRVRERWSEPQ
jgi:hypothetical protein